MPADVGRNSKPTRRSRLFSGRPDALLVEEWVPNISLPPPPDTPLEVDEEEGLFDENGMPTLEAEPEEETRGGPARLFVGVGQRGAALASEDEQGAAEGIVVHEPDDFFVAELRLPRPEDGLPFGLASRVSEEDSEEASAEQLLFADEALDDELDIDEMSLPFSVSVEAPDPVHLGAFGDAEDDEEEETRDEEDSLSDLLDHLGAPPSISLQPSLAREPLAKSASAPPGVRLRTAPVASPPKPPVPAPREGHQAPRHPIMTPVRKRRPREPEAPPLAPIVVRPVRGLDADTKRDSGVVHSRPFWTRKRKLPAPPSVQAPVFQPREAPSPRPIETTLFRRSILFLLLGLLVLVVLLELLGVLDLVG
jgi:hypothetical protein